MMRRNKYLPAKYVSWIAGLIIALLPFHAFLTVWLASLFGHYTLFRLWKEILLIPIVLAAVYYLLADKAMRRQLFASWIFRLMAAYWALLIICAAVPFAVHSVGTKAIWYGLLVNSRFMVFFAAVLVLARKTDWLADRWQRLLLMPATLVAAFAVLQYLVLPYDFLRHFGYSDATISPYETINHSINHLRVASTLRGANPLGAYLIVPLSVLAVYLFKEKRERWDKSVLGAGLLLALVFSFSRSAWIGAALSVCIIAWLLASSEKARRYGLYAAGALVIVVALAAIAFHNNHTFQETFMHTETGTTAKESSNYGHSAAMKRAVKDIAHHPQGGGVGSAGPQSFYNNHQARVAENYYLQIGQETGLIGMALFIAIIVLAAMALWRQRAEPLALALFASLIGLSLVNLLSHAWEDDTLAYIWWGLAGISLSPAILTDRLKAKNGQKSKT